MISRRTTLAIAHAYEVTFVEKHKSESRGYKDYYSINIDRLYYFLYALGYEAWFCNLSQDTKQTAYSREGATRKLRDFITRLHTGESLVIVTQNFSWEQREKLGQVYLQKLAEDILNADWVGDEEKTMLINHLELDGYVYQNKHLLTPETDVLDVKEEQGVLKDLYVSLGLGRRDVTLHHLSLSEEQYLAKKWEDSISNSRKFLESVLQEVAITFSQKVKKSPLKMEEYNRPGKVRDYLKKEGFLDSKECDVVDSIYHLLSETGSHPYMAQNDQARLLRHLALVTAQFVMLRLQGRLKTID